MQIQCLKFFRLQTVILDLSKLDTSKNGKSLCKTDTRLKLSTKKHFRESFILKLWLLRSLKPALEIRTSLMRLKIGRHFSKTSIAKNKLCNISVFLKTVIFDPFQTDFTKNLKMWVFWGLSKENRHFYNWKYILHKIDTYLILSMQTIL